MRGLEGGVKSWILTALAVGGAIGSAGVIYRTFFASSSSSERENESEADNSEQDGASVRSPSATTNSVETERALAPNAVPSDIQSGGSTATETVPMDSSIIAQTGAMFLSILGVVMMTIVMAVASILMVFDNDVDSPASYRMFGPLMWVSLGIVAASVDSQLGSPIPLLQPKSVDDHLDANGMSISESNYSAYAPAAVAPRSSQNDEEEMKEETPAPCTITKPRKSESDSSRSTTAVDDSASVPVSMNGVPPVSIQTNENGEKECTEVASLDPIVQEAENLYTENNHKKIRDILTVENEKNPRNVEVLWRLARACNDLSSRESSKEIGKDLAFEGLAYAKEALEVNNNSAAANKWVAIMTSTTGGFLDLKTKISGAYTIRDHIQRAIELDPRDATSRNIYGQWCLALADMTWMERKAAAALFGTPPTASYEQALEQFLAAEEISPGFWKLNTFLVAETLYKMGRKKESKEWLEKANQVQILVEEDREVQEKIDLLKRKL